MRDRSVYIARCLGPNGDPIGAIKVGCSFGFDKRLEAVARNQPFTLELITHVPGHLIMEKACHLYLKKYRIDGEFFHESEAVMKFANTAKERGTAFYYFSDDGFDHLPEKAVQAFMEYQGISLDAVCEYLGVPLKRYAGKLDGKRNSTVIAAAALLAQSQGRFVNWPGDALRGLVGERHFALSAKREEAA